jgi:pilus assembly protein CpaC
MSIKCSAHKARAVLFGALLAVLMSGAAISAAPSVHREIQLTAGAANTVELSESVADILVANPAIAEVGTMRSNRLYVVGKAVGDTNVLAFDAQGNQMADIAVHVSVDGTNIRDTLRKFFPREKIDARTVKNDIVLTGDVSTPVIANQIRDLAARFLTGQGQTVVDLMKVQGDQQVMLKVKVVEAKRNALREFGFDANFGAINASSVKNGASFAATGAQTGLAALSPFGQAQMFIDNGSHGTAFALGINALEQDGLANILAEPTLTAISGETASFLAGGEIPIPTAKDNQGNVTLEFKKFGVSLNFVPTVLSNDRISLQLSTEVSEKSAADGVTLVGTVIPGLTIRQAETTVQMASGGTLMIAGLLKSSDVHALNGFPGAQDLPIIGELFRSKSFSRDESELVFLVTPYIVEPYADAKAVEVSDTPQPLGATRPVMPPASGTLPSTAPSPQKHTDATPFAPAVPAAPMTSVAAADLPPPTEETREVSAPAAAAELPPPFPTSPGHAPRRPAAAQAAPAVFRPLSQSFVDNLQKVYGPRAPRQDMAAGVAFGYIVD